MGDRNHGDAQRVSIPVCEESSKVAASICQTLATAPTRSTGTFYPAVSAETGSLVIIVMGDRSSRWIETEAEVYMNSPVEVAGACLQVSGSSSCTMLTTWSCC